jgi:hypothetical protein
VPQGISLFAVRCENRGNGKGKEMLYSEQMKQICEKLGVNPDECKDGLYSTLLQTICDACGGGSGGGGGGGDNFPIGDGNTHIWISLAEGRTSPMLGVGVNGTVTVDWGDGSEPDVLTGTNTNAVVYTPNHAYQSAGEYIITLSGNGEIAFVGDYMYSRILTEQAASYPGNRAYTNAVKKIECGDNVISINAYAFSNCHSLATVDIPDGVTVTGEQTFNCCYSLASVDIPNGVKSIPMKAFSECYSLASMDITDGVTSIAASAFYNCKSLASVKIPASVMSIAAYAFQNCPAVAYYDFTEHTAVPSLEATSAFTGIWADCQFLVPASLYDEWKAATNWSTYASKIVGV